MASNKSAVPAPCALPPGTLLEKYAGGRGCTDCYATEVERAVTQAQYVEAFYTTWVFRLERLILKWAVSRPSTDAQAMRLAEGSLDTFAAWSVEARAPDQLLLCDLYGRTRSWLMAAPAGEGRTRLYFGSAVVPRKGQTGLGGRYRALLGFHKRYSKILLRAARARLLSRA
jgi:hypothetical protein